MAKIILTPDQEHALRDLDATIAELHRELDKAESVGLKIDDLRAALKGADTLRTNMIQMYGASSRVGY